PELPEVDSRRNGGCPQESPRWSGSVCRSRHGVLQEEGLKLSAPVCRGRLQTRSEWKSKGVVRNLLAKDRPSILRAPYALTRCSKRPILHAWSAALSRSSLAPAQPGTPTRWVRP